MKKSINVLVFPCGKENALEIHDALASNVNIHVYGASSVEDHGAFVYERYIGGLPFIQDPRFIDALNKVLETHGIDVVIPSHDTVVKFLTENRDKIHASIIAPSAEAAAICRDKILTYSNLEGNNVLPEWWSDWREISSSHFPLFVKPSVGEGGRNTRIVHNQDELKSAVEAIPEPLIAEFLPGLELTVDCFTDRHGKMRFFGPRVRERVVNGIAHECVRYPQTDELLHMAEVISDKLDMRGLWYFQVRKDKLDRFRLLEVSCRASGTMVFYRMLGVNFPLLSVYDALGYDVNISFNDIPLKLDRSIRNRFKLGYSFNSVYLDYDDTVIFGSKVNEKAMDLIYNWRNNGVHTHLITHHEGDLSQSLADHGISPGLFTRIIHLTPDQKKSEYIEKDASIFVDNAYQNRAEVKEALGIPVFDADALDCLRI